MRLSITTHGALHSYIGSHHFKSQWIASHKHAIFLPPFKVEHCIKRNPAVIQRNLSQHKAILSEISVSEIVLQLLYYFSCDICDIIGHVSVSIFSNFGWNMNICDIIGHVSVSIFSNFGWRLIITSISCANCLAKEFHKMLQ